MNDTRLNVFIQNLKDTTTVLQQLELCIKNIKDLLPYMDKVDVLETEVATLIAEKIYIHKLNVSYRISANATNSNTIYILSSDSEPYTLDTYKQYIANRGMQIPVTSYCGDNLKHMVFDFYYSYIVDKFYILASYIDNGALTNGQKEIDSSTITLTDTILN